MLILLMDVSKFGLFSTMRIKYYSCDRKGYPTCWMNRYITELLYREVEEDVVLSAPKSVVYVMMMVVGQSDNLTSEESSQMLEDERSYLTRKYPAAINAIQEYLSRDHPNYSVGAHAEFIKDQIWGGEDQFEDGSYTTSEESSSDSDSTEP